MLILDTFQAEDRKVSEVSEESQQNEFYINNLKQQYDQLFKSTQYQLPPKSKSPSDTVLPKEEEEFKNNLYFQWKKLTEAEYPNQVRNAITF